MSGWFSIDPNKLKQLATSTLINAQKRIDQVLDIKEGAAAAAGPELQPIVKSEVTSTNNDDFFSTFLGNVDTAATAKVDDDGQVEATQDRSFTQWNAWGLESNSAAQLVSSDIQSDSKAILEENQDRAPIDQSIESSSSIMDSISLQPHPAQSSSSLAESSTITESSSSESANSVRPLTTISPMIEATRGDDSSRSIMIEHGTLESIDEHRTEPRRSLPSEKRNVIDSWINDGDNTPVASNVEQSPDHLDDSDTSSSLYISSYPPNEFPNSSIIDDDSTPTSIATTLQDHETPSLTTANDEDDDSPSIEQTSSPTHTVSSSNGHETNSKGSSDDGKQTSCASSDIEVISSPSITSGLAVSTTDTFDKCRELRDARRPVVREVVVRFPTHSTNLKYHHQPLPMANIDKNTTSNFDAPSWSTLIDEAATERSSYDQSNEEDDHLRREGATLHGSEAETELSELKERLQSSERAFQKLTNESNELHRTNQSLKQSLSELEQRSSRLTTEFQQTIENLSMKIDEQKHFEQDRDRLRQQLNNLQKQLFDSSASSGNALSVLREKEEQIQQLLDEGEKLSRTQLQHTNIIKKLRSKEKESDTQITSLNTRIEKLIQELDETKKTLQEKEENEKQLKETAKKLEKSAVHYEKECLSVKSLYEDVDEQMRSLKVALENSYREIAELNKTKAASESKVVEATLTAEIALREEIRIAVDKERLSSRQEQDKLQMIVDELRHSIQRSEGQSNRKEQSLRQEIADLRQRLQEAESRNEELTQNISHATRPLLRQIENLQTTYITQINSLEKTEHQLTDRLAEMQAQYATSVEHERIAQETLLETNAKWKLAEAQLSTLKQDKIRLTSEVDILKMKSSNLEEARQREKNQIDSMQEAFTQQINSLIQEKRQHEIDAELERSKYESDLKKMQIIHDSLREQHDVFDNRSVSRTNSNLEATLAQQQRSRRSSGGQDTPTSFSFERSVFVSTPKPSVYESLRHSGAIAVLESLESQLKEKEGEISLLQSEVSDLERTRESMARELVNLSTDNERLREQAENYPLLKEQYKGLEVRYDALLTMYGEKQEEADELRLDLADVKTLYRAQIDDLTKQGSRTR